MSFPGNIFIIVVNILDFFKNRRLLLSDQLIFGFNVFSLLNGLHEGYILCTDIFPRIKNEYTAKEAHVSMYFSLSTLWFSALLSVHFCLKIVNINCGFYISLQRRFPKLFPWIIIAFLLEISFLSFYSALDTNQRCLQNTTSNLAFLKKSFQCSWLIWIFMIASGLCTFICSLSALTILISLIKHMRRIQGNSEGSNSPNMEAHIRAVKTITTLLAANFFIFTSKCYSIHRLEQHFWSKKPLHLK
ncbi:taste receptor type 2 member 2-like [Ranitomeya imitator]|uniref:taste receptor type 2 member 2-like n=1 Tax=Ranitomeya imitator TaxID=111125 RepID=UPI0037E81549